MMSIKNAVIIGGGVAGPATALALLKAGIPSTVYEEYGSTAEGVGGVLAVAPNGLNALGVIGVDIGALGQPIQRQVMADGSGKRWFEFGGLPGLPASRVVWRSELHRALHDHALERGIRVEHGRRLVSVGETEAGVTAHFADGSSARGSVLIGADGIRSTVRKLLDGGAPDPKYVGLLGFGGYAVDSGVSEPADTMYFAMGKRAFLGHWNARDGGIMWFSNFPSETPLGFNEARAISASEWLTQLRNVHADDVPGRALVEHTGPENLFVLGRWRRCLTSRGGTVAAWYSSAIPLTHRRRAPDRASHSHSRARSSWLGAFAMSLTCPRRFGATSGSAARGSRRSPPTPRRPTVERHPGRSRRPW